MKPSKNILKSLKKKGSGFIIPDNYLAEFDKKIRNTEESGFKIPENYFSNLEEQISSKLNMGKPVNSSGFITPTDYFKNIDLEILKKKKNTNVSRVFSILNNNYTKLIGLSIAASILLFIGINNRTSNNISFNSIEVTEIESWMEEDLITFSTYEITEAFGDINLNIENNYSESELLEYFNNIDIENLILEK